MYANVGELRACEVRRIPLLVLQCHFGLGYELSASLAVAERFHYPLPEALRPSLRHWR